MKRKSVAMTVVAVAVLLAGIPAFAQANKADIVIGNGTGGQITTMIISPAKAKYPKNQNCLEFKGLAISDKATFGVALPEQLKGIDAFDIELVSSGKRYKTQKEVTVNSKIRKIPTLELSRTGKDSTRAFIGAAVGGVGGAAVATVLSGTITVITMETLAVVGAVLGPTIVCVPAVFIPVALGAGGYLIGKALTSRGLDVQVYYN